MTKKENSDLSKLKSLWQKEKERMPVRKLSIIELSANSVISS